MNKLSIQKADVKWMTLDFKEKHGYRRAGYEIQKKKQKSESKSGFNAESQPGYSL